MVATGSNLKEIGKKMWYVCPNQGIPVYFETEEEAIQYKKELLERNIYSTHGRTD